MSQDFGAGRGRRIKPTLVAREFRPQSSPMFVRQILFLLVLSETVLVLVLDLTTMTDLKRIVSMLTRLIQRTQRAAERSVEYEYEYRDAEYEYELDRIAKS